MDIDIAHVRRQYSIRSTFPVKQEGNATLNVDIGNADRHVALRFFVFDSFIIRACARRNVFMLGSNSGIHKSSTNRSSTHVQVNSTMITMCGGVLNATGVQSFYRHW